MTKEEARLTLQENFGYLSDEHPRIIEAMKVAMNILSQPPLPSNLDEAAHEFEDKAMNDYEDIFVTEDGVERPVLKYDLTDAFKAGAEWMAGQGETVEGVFKAGDPGYPDVRMGEQYSIEHILRKPSGIEPGDEVIVQIIKRERR